MGQRRGGKTGADSLLVSSPADPSRGLFFSSPSTSSSGHKQQPLSCKTKPGQPPLLATKRNQTSPSILIVFCWELPSAKLSATARWDFSSLHTGLYSKTAAHPLSFFVETLCHFRLPFIPFKPPEHRAFPSTKAAALSPKKTEATRPFPCHFQSSLLSPFSSPPKPTRDLAAPHPSTGLLSLHQKTKPTAPAQPHAGPKPELFPFCSQAAAPLEEENNRSFSLFLSPKASQSWLSLNCCPSASPSSSSNGPPHLQQAPSAVSTDRPPPAATTRSHHRPIQISTSRRPST